VDLIVMYNNDMDIFSKIKGAFSKKEKAVSDSSAYTGFNTMLAGGDVSNQNLLANNKEWVFIATDKVSKAVASVRYKVMKYEKNGDDKEVFDNELARFLDRPSKHFTGKDFTYLTTAYKELTGNAFWDIRDVKNIIPLISTSVQPKVDKEKKLVGYKYQIGGKAYDYTLDEVVHDRYADPANPFWGVGKLSKIARWVDTSVYANEFNRLFFEQGAQFGGFFETDEESMERIKLIKAGLVNEHTGVRNAHKIGVLPKNTKFVAASATMQDMQFAEMDDKTRDKILAGFGVPKTLVGLTTDVNRASAEASEYIFAKYTVKPIVDGYVQFLNEYIVPLFDKTGQFYIAYDEFIPMNEEITIRENQAALANGAYKTINEVRAEHGLPRISGGDTIFGTPFGMPIGSPEKSVEVKPQRIRSLTVTKEKMSDDIAEKAVEALSKKKDKKSNDEIDEVKHKEFVSRVTAYQKQMMDKIQAFNQQQKREIIGKLQTLTRAVVKGEIFDYETEVELMVDMVSPLLTGLLTEQAIKEWEENGFAGAFNPTEENIAKIINDSATKMSKSYNDTTLNLIKNSLNEGIKNGESIAQMTSRIADIYAFSDTARALQVAHTETFYTANVASKIAYEQSGVVKTIRWYTSQDHRVCEFCGPLHGEIIDVQADFFKKGQTVYGANGGTLNLDYRSIGEPPLHPNCNCFIRPEEIVVGY
jgi:HK97 family phage portal protein